MYNFVIKCSFIYSFDGVIIILVPEYRDEQYDESSNVSGIPEVDGVHLAAPSTSQGPPLKKVKLTHAPTVTYDNSPVLTHIFVDPKTKERKLVVAFHMYSGVEEVKFNIEGEKDCQVLTLNYHWPKTMHSAKGMLTKPDGSLMLPEIHSMFVGLEEALMAHRANINDAPVGSISVHLPVAVKTDLKFIEKFHNKLTDGAIMFYMVFVCADNEYASAESEKTFRFV